MQEQKKISFLSGPFVVAFVVGAFFFGAFIGTHRAEERIPEITTPAEAGVDVDFSPFWEAWRILSERHIDAGKIDSQEVLLWSAIEGLASAYSDPYTVFFPPEEAREFEKEMRGTMDGIGVKIGMRDNRVVVIAPLKNTPAERAGMLPGDQILAVDQESALNLTIGEVVERIRGPRGTNVTLTIFRENENGPREMTVTRETIRVPVLSTEHRDDGIFVISLYNFSANTDVEFRAAMNKFRNSNSNKLLLDLRGNPGGYLEASIEVASYFLPAGKIIVREVGTSGKELRVFRSKGHDVISGTDTKVVVLIDRGSASASEILAGALRENNVATLVGETTFGKGSVQEVFRVTDETVLKVTIAEWLTPDGVSISEGGLSPDVVVPRGENRDDPEHDNQLERAVEILLQN
jgi:carboxyl-terminal processing protease